MEFVLVRMVKLKKRMDQLMYYILVGVLRIDMFRRQHGRGMRVIRLLNWIILFLAFLCATNFFFWFITSAKSMMGSEIGFRSRRARANAFFNNDPWTENDTIVSVSTAVKPIHEIEYHVNQTQLIMGSGKGRVTAFIDNPWTENDTNFAVPNVKTAVKPIHVVEYVNQTQLMMRSRNGKVTAFIHNPWTENDTIVSVSTAVKPTRLIEYVNNTGSGSANDQSIWFK